jgi:hypothetical protein
MSPMMSTASFDHCSDEDLMNRLIELYDHADENASELAALDAAIQARLAVTYTPEPGHSPRMRIAAA